MIRVCVGNMSNKGQMGNTSPPLGGPAVRWEPPEGKKFWHVSITEENYHQYTLQEFSVANEKFIVNKKEDFSCSCETYGSHQLFFCLCSQFLKDLFKAKNINALINKWMKCCSHSLSLESMTFKCSISFFSYSEVFGMIPIFWSYRENIFRKR